jgi:ATP-binding cassette subfamily F protein 3
MERLRTAKKEQDDEIARMRAFIDRFRYQATKAAQVQSRIKMLDKIQIMKCRPNESACISHSPRVRKVAGW